MEKIKILFILENLSVGGAERVLVNLVNNMDSERFDISVLTLFSDGLNADSLKNNIKYISLKRKKFKGIRLFTKFFPKRILYRLYVKEDDYDIVVAFMTGVPTFVAAGAKSKKISWLHGEFFENKKLYNFGLKSVYDRFDAVAGVSDFVCNSFKKAIDPVTDPVTVYNTNDVKKIRDSASEKFSLPFDKKGPLICSVGRLVKEKGFERLISAVIRLRSEVPGLELMIIGDGEEAGRLNSLINGYGAGEYIHLVGFDINPYKYMIRSDYFACSSYTEGLSTALTEAVILGMPCISTDVSGAKEILGENNEFGIVTENSEQGIYEGMKRLLEDEKIAEHYRKKAEERAAFFDTENTVKQAEDLFLSLMN